MDSSQPDSEIRNIHLPVLPAQVLEMLHPVQGGVYVDCTVGLGGHAELLLSEFPEVKMVVGFDCDLEAIKKAAKRLEPFGNKVRLINSSYTEVYEMLEAEKIQEVDGFLLDAGLSSYQLEHSKRGFSFKRDEPLDMRMNTDQAVTAADMINSLTEEGLAEIIKVYGEERWARKIAARIVERRAEKKFTTSAELASVVASAIPRRFHPRKIHPATRTFQGIRIAVNRELDNIKFALNSLPDLLKPGGRLCVISFHSLEDRIVKHCFREDHRLDVITKKPVVADQIERDENPRSRSAKLRCAERRLIK